MKWELIKGVHRLVGTSFTIEQSEPDDAVLYAGTRPVFAGDLASAKAAAEQMHAAGKHMAPVLLFPKRSKG